jgi:hypothetical protein
VNHGNVFARFPSGPPAPRISAITVKEAKKWRAFYAWRRIFPTKIPKVSKSSSAPVPSIALIN